MHRYRSWSSAAARPAASKEVEHPLKRAWTGTAVPSSQPPLRGHSPRPSLASAPRPRRPQAGRQFNSNELRPPVLATDRLQLWQTPHSLAYREEVSRILPPSLIDTAFNTVISSFAPNTKSTYAAGLLRFNQFCDSFAIPESDRMPASHILLVGFISSFKGKVSGKTIKSWLSGLKAWHDISHAPWLGDDRWVQMARTTANKEGVKFRRALRSPVTLDHLHALRRSLNLLSPFYAAVWVVASCAFWACRRFVVFPPLSAETNDSTSLA